MGGRQTDLGSLSLPPATTQTNLPPCLPEPRRERSTPGWALAASGPSPPRQRSTKRTQSCRPTPAPRPAICTETQDLPSPSVNGEARRLREKHERQGEALFEACKGKHESSIERACENSTWQKLHRVAYTVTDVGCDPYKVSCGHGRRPQDSPCFDATA